MKYSALAAFCGLGLLLAAAAPASARDLPAGGMTAHELAAWLQSIGLPATVKPDPSTPGDQIVSSSSDGVNWDIYLYTCNGDGDARRCASMQYAAGFSPIAGVDDAKMNEWNRVHRFIKAYLTPHGSPYGEYDLDLAPGGTSEGLNDTLANWRRNLPDFKTYVGH